MESKSKIDFLKDPTKIGDIITIDEKNLDLVDTNGFRFKIDVSNIQGKVRVAVFTTVDLFETEKLNPIIVYRHDSTISRPNLVGDDEFIDVNGITDLTVSYMPGDDEKRAYYKKIKHPEMFYLVEAGIEPCFQDET